MAMNGRLNCILEICCGATGSQMALADQIAEDLGADATEAAKYATWMKDNFDLAPKGSLGVLKSEVARLARQPQANAKNSPK